MASSDLDHWAAVNTELSSMVDTFRNLVKAARVLDDEPDSSAALGKQELGAPGELLEVLGEKLVFSGYLCLHHISELKKVAALSDFTTLIDNIRTVRHGLDTADAATTAWLASMQQEAHTLLHDMESSYYSSRHRGRLVQADISQGLQQLCQLALETPNNKASEPR